MVQLADLAYGYRNQPLLFSNLNLHLEVGHIYGLLGKNGAGKTTLLKNMVGLCYPKSGRVTVDGMDVGKRHPGLLSRVFFLPEEPFVPDMTAKAFLGATAPFYPNFDGLEFERYLNDFDVPTQRALNKLSLGQQKKFMIAFGLACRTALVVMDEPTNGLDIPSKVQFRKVLASAVDDKRCVVLSTHQVRDLDSLIDSVVVLHGGQIKLHVALDRLTERIRFGKVSGSASAVLYGEEAFDGTHAILPNPEGTPNEPNLELLFNAVIAESASVMDYLTKEEK